MRIYAASLNKNRAFQIINPEKSVNFGDFRQNKCIFMQPIVEKGASFADFRLYNHVCTQPIANEKLCILKNQC